MAKNKASPEVEASKLKFNKVELEHPYFYKELCSILGATYYGTCTRSIEKQFDSWKRYIVFERSGRKIVIKKILPETEWAQNQNVVFMNGLRKGSYNRQIFEILMYKLLVAGNSVDKTDEESGATEKWKSLSLSNYQWKVNFGLLSPQLKRYGNKLRKVVLTQIILYRLITITNLIYYRALKKIRDGTENKGLLFNKGGKIAYIDTTAPIADNDERKSLVKWGGSFYKIKIAEMTNEMRKYIEDVKDDVLKSLNCSSSTEAYDKGYKNDYVKAFKGYMDNLYYNDKKKEFISANKSCRQTVLRYKVINFWDTLIIEAKHQDIVAVLKSVKEQAGYDGNWAAKYFEEQIKNINEKVLQNIHNQISKDNLIPNTEQFDDIKALTEQELYLQAALLAKYNKTLFSGLTEKLDIKWSKSGEVKSALTKEMCLKVIDYIVEIFGRHDSINRERASIIDLTLKDHHSVREMRNIDFINSIFEDDYDE